MMRIIGQEPQGFPLTMSLQQRPILSLISLH